MISSENVPHYTLVLSEREINTIACAMNHIFIDEEGLSDPYFTKEEWSRVQRRRKNVLDKGKKISTSTSDFEEVHRWASKIDEVPLLCECIAHCCDDDLYPVIML